MGDDSRGLPNVSELQEEVMALITAWADRGLTPRESASMLAGMSHAILAKLGVTLGELVFHTTTKWKDHNGKL